MTPALWQLALGVGVAFLLGSIPFAFLIGKAKGVDIREHGSKNVGATNLGRVVGARYGFICFGLDVAKGIIPTLGFGLWTGAAGQLATPADAAWAWLGVAASAIAGHMFTPWLGFRGGKGVATGLGSLLGVFPAMSVPAGLGLLTWIIVFKQTRWVSLASIAGSSAIAALTPIFFLLAGEIEHAPPFAVVGLLLAAAVVAKHRGNIARLRAGTEPRVPRKKPEPDHPPAESPSGSSGSTTGSPASTSASSDATAS